MRIVETWNTKQFKTTIYALERWYVIEFEAGPMKQAYKLTKDKHPTTAQVKKVLNDTFNEGIYKNFEQMYINYKENGLK